MSNPEPFTETVILIERKRSGWIVSMRPPEGGVIVPLKRHDNLGQAFSDVGKTCNVIGLEAR